MQDKDKNYIFLIILHAVFGLAIYYIPFISKLYGIAIILYGFYYVVINQNRNNEVLYVCAYIIGSEIILRMTGGSPIYEFGKYGVVFFILVGVFYSGIAKNATAYWIFLLLLVPGVLIGVFSLPATAEIRKEISFNISGPVCLGLCSLYTFTRRVTFKQMNDILMMLALPIVTCTVFLVLYTPSVRDVVTGTGSSTETSGGFGPNQVSTVLGLGMFIFVTRLIFYSDTTIQKLVNLILILNLGFRGLVTFSRGGMITGAFMLVILLMFTYLKVNSGGRAKMNYIILLLSGIFLAVWAYSISQTDGLISKRYSNQDAAGRVKESRFTGREEIAAAEIELFLEHPIFGIGVGVSTEMRYEKSGELVLSHSEITRMLAEHGALGIMCLLILFLTPLFMYLDNKHNIFLVSFVVFWILTINHAAMRLAMPAFVYSLSLLKVVIDEKPVIHRE